MLDPTVPYPTIPLETEAEGRSGRLLPVRTCGVIPLRNSRRRALTPHQPCTFPPVGPSGNSLDDHTDPSFDLQRYGRWTHPPQLVIVPTSSGWLSFRARTGITASGASTVTT